MFSITSSNPVASNPVSAAYQSATQRRELRRDIRAALGTSSDKAPGFERALGIHTAVSNLISLATNGRFCTIIMDNRTQNCVSVPSALAYCRDRANGVTPAGGVVFSGTEVDEIREAILWAGARRSLSPDTLDKIGA